jgi:Ran GTPase-activating protein (RanGAP) involved in mRNA processing and transport
MKAKILKKYLDLADHSKLQISKQVKDYLENEDEFNDQNDEIVNIIFPGNDKYNFNCRLKDDDMQPLSISYMTCVVNLRCLNLSYNKISDKGVLILCKLLEFAENIVEVNLAGNQIKDSCCEKLSSSLKGKIFLYLLNLNTNQISNSGIMHINELLFTNPGIMILDLGCNRYDWDGLIAITTALTTTNSTLQVLNVDDPLYKIQDQDFFTHFGKMFLSNSGLRKISLQLHKLRFEGVEIITHHLQFNSTLRVLDLSCNQICFQGILYIRRYLENTKTLKSILLASNKIADQGAKLFAQGIALNKSVVHVDLTSNMITDEGLCRLAEGLSENNSVRSLKLFWNNKLSTPDCMRYYQDLLKIKGNDFYPDFVIYDDETGEINIAYLETHIPNENEYFVI